MVNDLFRSTTHVAGTGQAMSNVMFQVAQFGAVGLADLAVGLGTLGGAPVSYRAAMQKFTRLLTRPR